MGSDTHASEGTGVRPPYHLRLDLEDEDGATVCTAVGAGHTPQEAFDEAMSFAANLAHSEEMHEHEEGS